MPRSRLHRHVAVVTMLLAAVACSNDEAPSEPRGLDAAAIDADIATTAGASIASDVAVLMGNEASVATGFGATGAVGSPNCTRDGNVTTCTGGRDGTLEVTRNVRYFDAAGATQPQYDATTTARIDFGVRVAGTMSGPSFSGTVDRSSIMHVTGLAGSETQRTWNGVGTASERGTFTGPDATRTHEMVASDTTTDVTWVVAPTRAQYPASGSVVRRIAVRTTISGTRSGTFSAARRVEVTFNGTAQVPLTVSAVARGGTTVTRTCQLDLAARSLACAEPTGQTAP